MKKILLICLTMLLIFACSSSNNEEPIVADDTVDDMVDDTVDDAVDDGPSGVTPLTDIEMMDLVQEETFKYFWDFANSNSGAAKERYIPANPTQDQNTVTTGGTGFGLMAILVGIERGYISRSEGVARLNQILTFYENADRFHGAWSHWIDGNSGNVLPFSALDNGGDLVETAFFAQGLICVKEYFKEGSVEEIALANQADALWKGVEWDWYTQGDECSDIGIGALIMGCYSDLKLTGYNETMIAYILGAASPDFPIPTAAYTNGWAGNGNIISGNTQYGFPLILRHSGSPQLGGPLFFSHYSFLGLNPTTLSDQYASNYFNVAKNHTEINRQYCVANPLNFEDYGPDCWGLTASYTRNQDGSLGYTAHSPGNDNGTITPTAAISSIPYTPMESLDAMHYFYQNKDDLLGPAGFYDAFSPEFGFWVAKAYLAIDQGPEIIMIENYRTGLLWNLFMQNTDVQNGLTNLGFTY